MKPNQLLASSCAMTRTMGILGGKWKPLIIWGIGQRRIRFGQLAAHMPLISRKVLAEQLKELEEAGLILREAFNEVPPRVDYSLTENGLRLLPILESLRDWTKSCEAAGTPASGPCLVEKQA
ncbi:helix-turn-helix transcriptional regulator [Hymenobacter sp. BT186]|uniref:Helix-turn-helix transcriptional regulator n=1 Tax=Hymenobacter telluris TaxID=2816474 RepID=A0A939EVP2_9BACT|nr:helix-turn-helix domain-containing protein [Hymenobacter telluris]MBO0358365.1 helix-turn-helix transcriptional regulator [Hymenobacter telluris]MBW3374391.1 helix-turn-helix transcriptional regulator [Hymenobacter norwichensis]